MKDTHIDDRKQDCIHLILYFLRSSLLKPFSFFIKKQLFILYALLVGAISPLAQAGSFQLNDLEWRERLGDERYNVMRKKQTEPAFTGTFFLEEREGIYSCAGCGSPLFESGDKFLMPGCGWPLFKKPIEAKKIEYQEDFRLGFKRYEVLCRNCDCHLGHVFKDGPPPKYLRYIINSLALEFTQKSRQNKFK